VVRPEHAAPIQETIKYLPFAEGPIDPSNRIAQGEIDVQIVDELITRIQGDEYTLHGDPTAIVNECMDSRGQTNGHMVVGVKAAGGTTCMVLMDALTNDSYRAPGDKAPTHKATIFGELKKNQQPVGGHTADTVPDPQYAGCGAEDKLDAPDDEHPQKPSTLRLLTQQANTIFDFMREAGYKVEPKLAQHITGKGQALRNEHYATSGKELSDAGDPKHRKVLTGDQKAVLVVIMTEPGAYLDQEAINKDYGHDYEVFEVAAWGIENSAKEISVTSEDQHAKTIAGVAFSLATAGVIVGPGMPILIR
jgi:hypothetical protein